MKRKDLIVEKEIEIRFSEVDSMNIVWHGSYMQYFEDAREEFGRKYKLGYQDIYNNGFYAPLVDISFQYKQPIFYGEKVKVIIKYVYKESSKIVFEYIIKDSEGNIRTTGISTQVFLDMDYKLLWYKPEYYTDWQNKTLVYD
ncbi:acyl-CoA thioesterase [Marinilabiliaceae bacterium JC040]|nr:acyl-CoA thioesterase [Marinilabiliaceae bacterium JC040]